MPAVNENRTILQDADGRQVIVPERSSGPLITMTLLDETGSPVPLSAISAATLTLFARDESGSPILNSVDGVDVLNAGRGTIHATSGLLTLMLVSADNVIQNSANSLEWHRALIQVTYSGKSMKYEIDFPVRNLARVS